MLIDIMNSNAVRILSQRNFQDDIWKEIGKYTKKLVYTNNFALEYQMWRIIMHYAKFRN